MSNIIAGSIDKISLNILQEIYNPFLRCIWMNVNSPITRKEISDIIKNKKLISPNEPKKMFLCWDESTREEHIQRIAWFVTNWNDNYPIEIDFGSPSLGFISSEIITDGNHRLFAAFYMKKNFIHAICSGELKEIEKYKYSK